MKEVENENKRQLDQLPGDIRFGSFKIGAQVMSHNMIQDPNQGIILSGTFGRLLTLFHVSFICSFMV
jgi:hypothetical protein